MTSVGADMAQLEFVGLTPGELVQAWEILLPNVIGIVVYLVFIFEFYQFVSRRDVFKLQLRQYASGPLGRGIAALENTIRVGVYVLEYLLFYPVLIIIWYLAFVTFLAFLAFDLGTETLLLIAMAVVASIRVTAYYSEDLSRDLAKMLPLALLGVVILEGSNAISFEQSLVLVFDIPNHWRQVLTYLILLVPLELGLRIGRILVTGRLGTVIPPNSTHAPSTMKEGAVTEDDPES